MVLKGLTDEGVRNIPELACHGYVVRPFTSGLCESRGFISRNADGVQTTQTDKFANEPWVRSLHPMDKHHKSIPCNHYRLVTSGAGFRLSTFRGTQELLSAAFDVFTGNAPVRHWSTAEHILSQP